MSDLVRWDWVASHSGEIVTRLWEHAVLTFLAVGIGFVISLPLGILAYRYRRAYAPVTSVAGILYTIPSLALFAFLVPFTGLSVTTAEIGLVSYTLLILIRNIVGGLDRVPEDAKEAARGMGYSDRQMLLRVELPLAVPVILAGVRIATVTTIGLVTVTALIDQGGLGHFILLGIRRFFNTAIIVGVTLSVAFAIVMERLLIGAERLVTPWSRRGAGAG